MTTTTTTHTLRRYDDATAIGRCVLTAEQHQHYIEMADSHTGAIRLGAMPHDYYDLDDDHQGTHEDTAVYVEPCTD